MVQDRFAECDVERPVVVGELFAGRHLEGDPVLDAGHLRTATRDFDALLGEVEGRHVGATPREEHGQLAQATAVLDDPLTANVAEVLDDAGQQGVAPGDTRRNPRRVWVA